MYHVVMGVGADDDQVDLKVDAVSDLPADGSVRVTVLHARGAPAADDATPEDPQTVPSVARTLEALGEVGVEAEAVAVEGRPTDALLEYAGEVDAECICVGGRRRSPAGKLQLKNGAQQVIVNADRPVLVVGTVG